MMRICQSWLSVATIALIASACGGGGKGSDGPKVDNVPVTVSKQAGDGQTGTVGATLAVAPSVKVLNFAGTGAAGVAVTFTASSGDVLGTTSAISGADGTASAGSWKLGNVAGAHTVSAAAAGVAIPATFSATANADVPKSMVKLNGDLQTGTVGNNVPIPPSVTISDMHGNPVTGTTVSFSVGTGGGSVTGGVAQSGTGGAAAVGSWRMGAAPGANSLIATSAGLTSLTFTATGITDPCTTITPVAFGATVNGTLAATDCVVAEAYFADLFSFPLGAGQFAQMEMTSATFDPWLDFGGITGETLLAFASSDAGTTPARIQLLAPPATYTAVPNSTEEQATGAYTFTVGPWSGDAAACSGVWIVPGSPVYTQTVAATDCTSNAAGGPFFADGFFVVAQQGRTYTITMASAAVDPRLRLVDGLTGAEIGVDDNSGGGTTARITWTPTTLSIGVIFATTAVGSSSGAYTISVTSTGGAASSLRPATGRAARPPAFARAGAPSVSLRELFQRAARGAPRP